jgi:enamine deaminase RidA (YjgF/YER057c/UK114 family)
MRRLILLAAASSMAAATAAAAQDFPLRLPAPNGGEVILPSAADKRAHDQYRYAAVRRAGDYLYLSGVIVFRRPEEGTDVEAFKAQTRRSLNIIKRNLEAAGASFQDVVMINSFHGWQGPNFTGTRDEQFEAFDAVVGEYIKPPYPAWTAVGTTGLLMDGGIVEMQVIAYSLVKK